MLIAVLGGPGKVASLPLLAYIAYRIDNFVVHLWMFLLCCTGALYCGTVNVTIPVHDNIDAKLRSQTIWAGAPSPKRKQARLLPDFGSKPCTLAHQILDPAKKANHDTLMFSKPVYTCLFTSL